MGKLKLVVLALFLVSSGTTINAQETTVVAASKEKIDKKQQRKLMSKERLADAKVLSESKSYVIEANVIRGRQGPTMDVVSHDNYMLVNGDKFVFQTTSLRGRGLNEFGGITATGKITKYKVIERKNGTISVVAQVSTALLGQGTLTVNFNRSGYDFATFTNNWGAMITFYGRLVSLEESDVYQGRSRL